MKNKFIQFLFVSVLITSFISCNSLRQALNIKKEFKGEVTICNEKDDEVKYSVELLGESKEFKEGTISKNFKGSNFSMEIPYRKKISVKIKIDSSSKYSDSDIKEKKDFNIEQTYPFNLNPSKKFNGIVTVYNEKGKIKQLQITVPNAGVKETIDSVDNIQLLIPCFLNNKFQLNIIFAETDEYMADTTTVFISNNNFSINLKPKHKKFEGFKDDIKEIDETLSYAKEKLTDLEIKAKNTKNKKEQEILYKYIENRRKKIDTLEAEFKKQKDIINTIKQKIENDEIVASHFSVLDKKFEEKINKARVSSTNFFNEFCNVDNETGDDNLFVFKSKGIVTYPKNKYLFKDAYPVGQDSFNTFIKEIKKYKKDKKKHTNYNELYIVIQTECSADGLDLKENAFYTEYNDIVESDGYVRKYKFYPTNIGNSPPEDRRLAFLRAYYLLEKIYTEFPDLNYRIILFDNHGSSLAPDHEDRPEFRYSDYYIRINTKEVFENLHHDKN